MALFTTTLMELELASGIRVQMQSLSQRGTYLGLLLGLPSEDGNPFFIDQIMQAAKREWSRFPTVLIPPAIRVEAVKDVDMEMHDVPVLPSFGMYAHLEAFEVVKDKVMDYSALTLVWFQETVAPPIADEVMAQIYQLDWMALSQDYQIF